MPSAMRQILRYLRPDRTVLTERPDFDDDISAQLFRVCPGSEVGCLTLHGIGGTPANVRAVADALCREGYTVLSPALPGHRETVGALNASTEAEWRECALLAYDRLVAAGCKRIYAFGLSLGGLLCTYLAEETPLAGVGVICAPFRMTKFLRIGRVVRKLVPFIRYPESKREEPDDDAAPYRQMYDGFSLLKLQDLTLLEKRIIPRLSEIRCPILAISAEWDDKVDPVSFDILKKGAVSAASYERVHMAASPHGCTYGPERDEVAARCVAFVKALEEKRS